MPTVTIDYFGFSGSGPTVKEAKQDAGRKIQALHADTWTPVIREWRGFAILVYRNLNGWEYTFISHPGEPLRIPAGCSCGFHDRADAVKSAERHIADVGWSHTDPLGAFPVWFGTDQNREHAHMRREIIDGRKWQLQMRHLMQNGITDQSARLMIGGLEPLPDGVTLLDFSEVTNAA